MSTSVGPDETSHLEICCLQKPIIIACGSERVNILHKQVLSGCTKISISTDQNAINEI